MGKRLAGLSTQQMNLNADMGSRMTERFNVAGALLVKLFGNPSCEDREYAERAAKVRDAGIKIAMNRTVFMVALGLVAALATAMVYGFGGVMAVNGTLTVGTLLALAALLGRLYAPLTAISNVRVDVMTALVSFERVFEVLDLQPLVTEKDDARTLPEGPLGIDVDHVSFRYPRPTRCRSPRWSRPRPATVGPETPCCTTCRSRWRRVSSSPWSDRPGPARRRSPRWCRALRPGSGAVRVGDVDLRDVTMQSLHDSVGVVTQDAHLFHDTIRANLAYARPEGPRSRCGPRWRRRRCSGWSTRCPRASTPSSATAVTASPAERSSGSRSRGCCSRVLG